MLASDINEKLSCLFLFVCFVFLQCNFSSFSQLFPQRDNHLVFKVYIVVFPRKLQMKFRGLPKISGPMLPYQITCCTIPGGMIQLLL